MKNFLKVVSASSVADKRCTGCGTKFSENDSRKVFLTTTGHHFCGYCYNQSCPDCESAALYCEREGLPLEIPDHKRPLASFK